MGVVAASLSKAVERDTAPKMIDPRQTVSGAKLKDAYTVGV
jgi:hypothetical protein